MSPPLVTGREPVLVPNPIQQGLKPLCRQQQAMPRQVLVPNPIQQGLPTKEEQTSIRGNFLLSCESWALALRHLLPAG